MLKPQILFRASELTSAKNKELQKHLKGTQNPVRRHIFGMVAMSSAIAKVLCLSGLAATRAFVAPFAARCGAPLVADRRTCDSSAVLRMSDSGSASGGGDDEPFVFPR